jgi:hypothetical protein
MLTLSLCLAVNINVYYRYILKLIKILGFIVRLIYIYNNKSIKQ